MKAFLDQLFALAKASGIEAAEAFVLEQESFQAAVNNAEITQYSANTRRGLGFRGMVQGKMGYASTEAFDDAAAEQLVRGVLDSANLCENTDTQFLYDGSGDYPELKLHSEALDQVSPEEKLNLVLALEQKAKDYDPRIEKVGDTTVLTSKSTVRIVNTLGLDRQYAENFCGAYLQPIAHEGNSTTTGFELLFGHDFSSLNAESLGSSAAKKAVDALHGAPVASGTYRVLFTPDAMASLLGVFSDAFSAETVQQGLSLYKGKLGEAVASPCVTLMDDPLLASGLASRPFDAEGVPSRTNVVVEAGVLRTFLHNLKTAHKDGVQTTGNASKAGYSASVTVSPSNFFFKPGTQTQEELLQAAGSGLVISELSGLHAGADAISGDFSLLSKGYTFENGKRVKPVEQITVAGNFYELLKQIRAVGSDLLFPESGMGSPTIDAGELSVAGA